MNPRVLFVDHDERLLEQLRDALRELFEIDATCSPAAGLAQLEAGPPYCVIVCGMHLAEMSGVELLAKARRITPDTVRIMLTADAGQQTAAQAINTGEIFRFLAKPCEPSALARAVGAGVKQHRLLTAERELLEETLRGAVEVMVEVLAVTNPEVFGRTARIAQLVTELSETMGLENRWEFEAAAMLSQIGSVALSDEIIAKAARGRPLTEEELVRWREHPGFGADIIAKVPRLDKVAEAIRYQGHLFCGTPRDVTAPSGEDLPVGARLLRVALDTEISHSNGLTTKEALARLQARAERYDPKILDALETIAGRSQPTEVVGAALKALPLGSVLCEDVFTSDGSLVVGTGQEVTETLRNRLRAFETRCNMNQQVMVQRSVAVAEA